MKETSFKITHSIECLIPMIKCVYPDCRFNQKGRNRVYAYLKRPTTKLEKQQTFYAPNKT